MKYILGKSVSDTYKRLHSKSKIFSTETNFLLPLQTIRHSFILYREFASPPEGGECQEDEGI